MQCSACHCGIWVSPSTIKDMPDQLGEVVLLCEQCNTAEIEQAITEGSPVDVVPLSKGQRAELDASHGSSS